MTALYLHYLGMVHSLVGETETGKTWLALLFSYQEIMRNEQVGRLMPRSTPATC